MRMKWCIYLPLLVLFTTTGLLRAQMVADFESHGLGLDTFANGADSSRGFWEPSEQDSTLWFPTEYNFEYGYWSGGWALSTMRNDTTRGYTNLYSAITAGGVQSPTYAIGQQGSKIHVRSLHALKPLSVYITNTTYAYWSMKEGDQFAKKFGGDDGTDPDYFVLRIYGYKDGHKDTVHYVEFYLADYRFDDSTKDYIVDSWTRVDLSPLGYVDSLEFVLSSSDVGPYGINTPLFFAIDSLTFQVQSTYASSVEKPFVLRSYPNPATDQLQVEIPQAGTLIIVDAQGQRVWHKIVGPGTHRLSVHQWTNGMYTIRYRPQDGTHIYSKRIVKWR